MTWGNNVRLIAFSCSSTHSVYPRKITWSASRYCFYSFSLVFCEFRMARTYRSARLHSDSRYWPIAAAVLAITFLTLPCAAQDLQPRRWGHLPIDTNFSGLGYAFTGADVAFDPVLLIEDVKLDLNSLPLKYIRTFELLGKSARIDVLQAYQDAEWNGLVDGVPTRVTRSGWSDTVLRFAVNLVGCAAAQRSGVRRISSRGRVRNHRRTGAGIADSHGPVFQR